MMYGHEKSDHAIVAGKLTNKAEGSAAELVERRAGTEGNARQLSTRRTPSRVSVRWLVYGTELPSIPEVGAVCGKAARTDLGGGREVTRVPTAFGRHSGFDPSATLAVHCGNGFDAPV